jgi:hypothetical protein
MRRSLARSFLGRAVLASWFGAGLIACQTREEAVLESKRLALMAAEAGAEAGKAYVKDHCQQGRMAESILSAPGNVRPLPVAFPRDAQQVQAAGASFRATVLNNADDPRFGDGRDSDGIVMLVATGTGPLRHEVTLELRLDATRCPEEVLVRAVAVPRWR